MVVLEAISVEAISKKNMYPGILTGKRQRSVKFLIKFVTFFEYTFVGDNLYRNFYGILNENFFNLLVFIN